MTSSSCAVTNLEKLLLLSFYFLAKVKAHPHNVTSDPKLRRRKNFTSGFKNQEVSQKKKKCIGILDDIFQIICLASNI